MYISPFIFSADNKQMTDCIFSPKYQWFLYGKVGFVYYCKSWQVSLKRLEQKPRHERR